MKYNMFSANLQKPLNNTNIKCYCIWIANLILISHFSISTYQIPHQITQMILKEMEWNVLYRYHTCTYAHARPLKPIRLKRIKGENYNIWDKFVTGYVLPIKCTNKCHRFPIYFEKEKNDNNWRYMYLF